MSIRCCRDKTWAVLEINFVKVVVASNWEYGEFCLSSNIWHFVKLKKREKFVKWHEISWKYVKFREIITCHQNSEMWPMPSRLQILLRHLNFHTTVYRVLPVSGPPETIKFVKSDVFREVMYLDFFPWNQIYYLKSISFNFGNIRRISVELDSQCGNLRISSMQILREIKYRDSRSLKTDIFRRYDRISRIFLHFLKG